MYNAMGNDSHYTKATLTCTHTLELWQVCVCVCVERHILNAYYISSWSICQRLPLIYVHRTYTYVCIYIYTYLAQIIAGSF